MADKKISQLDAGGTLKTTDTVAAYRSGATDDVGCQIAKYGSVATLDVDDVDAGTLAVANGGTGGITAAAARTNLGLVIGTDVLANVVEDLTPQLGGALDANGSNIQFDDGTGIADDSGNEQLLFGKTASAINYAKLTNSAVGNGVTLATAGGDAAIDLILSPKGTGIIDCTGNVDLPASGALTVNGTAVISDAAGTATLANIDALDATTEATIEAAIDTLANLTSIQGFTFTMTGNLVMSGAFNLTFTITAATNVTLPTTGTLATLAGAETLTNKILTAPDINGGTADSLTSLSVRSTGAAFDLTIASTEVFTAGRTLTLTLNDAARTVDLGGNVTLAGAMTTGGAFTVSGAFATTLTVTGATTVTLPTTGTLMANVVEDTTPQLGGNLDTNAKNLLIDSGFGILDESGNEQLVFATVATAVNYLQITNAAAGNGAELAAKGSDTDVSLLLAGQGAGLIQFKSSAVPDTNNTQSLGSTVAKWADLFLGDGGQINFNSSDVNITHSTNTLAFTGATSGYNFDALVDISGAAAGQIKFPATQNASANANTLDDYEEGTWTPVLTFATAGDLSVAYTTQKGNYTKIGRHVFLAMNITTSTFTHGTASGNCRITGVPFTAEATDALNYYSAASWQGITKASYTNVIARILTGVAYVEFNISGSGQAVAVVTATDMPTGGTVVLTCDLPYIT